jgi:hypothetical protein
MAKKIYDIKPPKKVGKTEKEHKDLLENNKRKRHHARQKKEGRSIWKPVLISSIIIILIVGVYLFFKLPKAEITIWPKVDVLSFKQTITADKSADLIDLTNSVIPAQYFEVTKTKSQDFPATGSASNDGKASGTITIYNKYDPPASLTFKVGTHFMSDSGKLFVASQKIIIPAAKKSGSKITPGSVQVQVQAVEAGDSYNIASANFSVPGLKGTAYYYSIYATSTDAMTGGYTGKVKKVTDDDIQGAKDVLTKETTLEAVSALRSQISSDYVLLDNAVLFNTTGASTQTKSGTIADSFNYQATVKASAIAFKKSDLDQFVKNYIISQMSEGKALLESSLKTDYLANTVDVSGGKMALSLDFSSGVYQKIDRNSLSLSLFGENAEQIKRTIDSNLGDQASKIQIKLWPFWVKSAPNSQNAINIELKF